MPGFVAIHPITQQERLSSTDFWPAIDLAHVRAIAKLDGTIPDAHLHHAVIMAIDSVNNELAAWEGQQRAAGFRRLADVPSTLLNGQHRLSALYVQAVICVASADLLEQLRAYDSSHHGQQQADASARAVMNSGGPRTGPSARC